ncbi:MAG: RDD family protein [Syntrophaceae bacterium]|nr:RDD family protein [Syntrophaceae bacterium]
MDRHYGGFWRRLYAFTVDKIILGFIGMVLFFVGATAFGLGISPRAMSADPEALLELGGRVFLLYQTVTVLLDMAYFTYFHGTTGQTPGKRLLGLRVVQETGEPIGFGTAFLRWVGYIVSGIPMLMGFLWAGADRRKQGWHDKIAGTVVIDLYQVVEIEIPPKNALTNQGNLFS